MRPPRSLRNPVYHMPHLNASERTGSSVSLRRFLAVGPRIYDRTECQNVYTRMRRPRTNNKRSRNATHVSYHIRIYDDDTTASLNLSLSVYLSLSRSPFECIVWRRRPLKDFLGPVHPEEVVHLAIPHLERKTAARERERERKRTIGRGGGSGQRRSRERKKGLHATRKNAKTKCLRGNPIQFSPDAREM